MGDRIVGRILEGRYRIIERLAHGGMSTVYRANDERLDREVAVKVMSAALSTDPAFAGRFAHEARIAARLSHLNAVSVYDQGTDDGHVFLVMELVRGRTLRDLLREYGALSPAAAVSIMEPVLGALAAAHRAGLVHRDVKPENILLSDDGLVKVADFGLARAIESDVSNTRTGLMMGTVAYCPPEQIARGNADARSDVYASGVMLFELLTGTAPYVGDSAMAVAYQHVHSDVPPPSSRRPGVPPQLDEVVVRATRREPSARPLDAGALLAELHDVRVDLALPVVAVPPRRPAQPAAPPAGRPPSTDRDTQVIDAISPHPAEAPTAPNPRPPASREAPYPIGQQDTVVSAASAPAAFAAPAASTRPAAASSVNSSRPPTAQPEAAGKSGRKPRTRRQRARRRATIWVLIVLLLGILTGYGAWWLVVGRYDKVPDVVGQSQSAATRQLTETGFGVSAAVAQQYDETVASGRIITTRPGPNAHILKGKMVQLVISRGPERFAVPTVANLTYAAAVQKFRALPVTLTTDKEYDPSGKIAAGKVISTSPVAGTPVKRNSAVKVVVSLGPPVINVPGVVGKTKAEAQGLLAQQGFTATFSEQYDEVVPSGQVVSQAPGTGSQAVKFSQVSVVLSKGPQLVTIPDIQKGSDPSQATAALQALGLEVAINRKHKGLFDFSGYKVDSVDPRPGNQVRIGSTVTLTIK
ncbi:MAG: spk [Frankiales bacterium]|nr:spk [Frankiales bacterium]